MIRKKLYVVIVVYVHVARLIKHRRIAQVARMCDGASSKWVYGDSSPQII
jgi:hypothetical protein